MDYVRKDQDQNINTLHRLPQVHHLLKRGKIEFVIGHVLLTIQERLHLTVLSGEIQHIKLRLNVLVRVAKP